MAFVFLASLVPSSHGGKVSALWVQAPSFSPDRLSSEHIMSVETGGRLFKRSLD